MSNGSIKPPVHQSVAVPFWKTLVAGGFAGITECLIMYPTDVLKTRAQLATTRLTMAECTRQIIYNEGFWTFYRGITAPLLAEAPKRAVKFSTNSLYKGWFTASDGKLSNSGAGAAGFLAGVTEALCNCPFEVVKIRMQAAENKALYSSTLDCATKVLRQEGLVNGLYKGLEAQAWRNGVWNGVYFGVIGTMHNVSPVSKDASPLERHLHTLLVGMGAGSLGVCLNTPLDVVKSRIQNQKPGQVMKYNWALPSLITIAREEGIANLYKGVAPKLLRLGPGGGIMALTYNYVLDLLK